MKVNISRDELEFQLVPFKYNNAIIFATELKGFRGLFGAERNEIFFISEDFLDSELEIELPDTIEDNTTMYATITWLIQRILMTPNFKIKWPEEKNPIKAKEVLKYLYKIIKGYEDGLSKLEKNHG